MRSPPSKRQPLLLRPRSFLLRHLALLVWLLPLLGTSGRASSAERPDGAPASAPVEPLFRAVDLDPGESADLEIPGVGKVAVELLDLAERRSDLRDAVREAAVSVRVDGETVRLVAATYNLPRTVGRVQIDCPVTRGYTRGSSKANVWALDKAARLRVWPAGSPWIRPGTFAYPVDQRWFASDTQMGNDPCYVNACDVPGQKSVYYHYGLDFGGAEGLVSVTAATDGLVVSRAGEIIPGEHPKQVAPRHDVVYLRDDRGWYYRYSHLQRILPSVRLGERVRMGERIGILGKEGGSGGWSHLHLDICMPQPSGRYGIADAYAFAFQAYRERRRPRLIAVARPHHVAWAGEAVTLDASRSWHADGPEGIRRFEWRLDDGRVVAGPRAEVRYERPGHYSELIEVTDRDGERSYDIAVVQVFDREAPLPVPPAIHVASWPTDGIRPGDEVVFKARTFGVRPDEGEETWDFGDGSPPATTRSDGNANHHAPEGYATIRHRFAAPGDLVITVRRSNDRGQTATGRIWLRVEAAEARLDSGREDWDPDEDEPLSRALVRGIRVLPDGAPDCTSLEAIVRSVTRGLETNDAKAVALYNFLNLALYHRQYPSEPGGISALKLINVYGWGLCGGQHTVQAALWKTLGWRWRYVGWSDPGHTTVEAEYDGRWHYLDVFLRFYAWTPDPEAPGRRTIASQADIKGNPSLLEDGFWLDPDRKVCYQTENRFEVVGDVANWTAPAFLVCGDDIPGILKGVSRSSRAGSPEGWGGIAFDDPAYSTDVDLPPGASLTLLWDPIDGAHWFSGRKEAPLHTCGDKDFRNCPAIGPVLEPYRGAGPWRRTFGSGRLVFAPDLSGTDALRSFDAHENVRVSGGALRPLDPSRPGSVTVLLRSPYILTRARASGERIDAAEVSTDGGRTFGEVDPASLDEALDDAVGGKYAALVRLGFSGPLRDVRVEATVQSNPTVLPYLSPGRNRVVVSTRDPKELGANRLVVTYAYRPGFRTKSYAELAEDGKEVARAHNATWSEELTLVRKVFRAEDLPATFEIDVPTPKDAHPVYPRMVFVRREVIAPGGSPGTFPEDPHPSPTRVIDGGEELKTLPSPFRMGIARPPPRILRPTTLRKVPVLYGHVASARGEVAARQMLRWPKMAGEDVVAQALLLSAELGDLPAARDIAAARLVVPVAGGHDRAPGQFGAVLLGKPFEEGKPYDLADLGDPVGVVLIPRQPEGTPAYVPPRRFPIDVTRAIRAISAGERTFHGFGLRIVPNRAVDDGWTVRADIPPDAPVELEIEVYESP